MRHDLLSATVEKSIKNLSRAISCSRLLPAAASGKGTGALPPQPFCGGDMPCEGYGVCVISITWLTACADENTGMPAFIR
jgi:hypothetical protein